MPLLIPTSVLNDHMIDVIESNVIGVLNPNAFTTEMKSNWTAYLAPRTRTVLIDRENQIVARVQSRRQLLMMTIPRNDQILPIYVTTSALILLHRPLFFSFENNDLSMTIVSRPSLSYFNLLDKHIKKPFG